MFGFAYVLKSEMTIKRKNKKAGLRLPLVKRKQVFFITKPTYELFYLFP